MGFEVQRKVFRLAFGDEDLAGLEVSVQEVPLAMLLGLMRAADSFDEDHFTPADGERLEELLRTFGRMLHSWNVTDGGEPVPATYEGLASLPPDFALRLLRSALETVSSAPRPLPDGSRSGASSAEAALAAASQSRSPQNS